jgi:hypothetical protein
MNEPSSCSTLVRRRDARLLVSTRHTDDLALTTDVIASVGRHPFQSVSSRDLLRDKPGFKPHDDRFGLRAGMVSTCSVRLLHPWIPAEVVECAWR